MSADRKPLSKRVRFEVFKRDRFICQYCGGHPPMVVLHCDHIVPVSEGGQNRLENLVTACSDCNLGKSNVLLTHVSPSLADKAARVTEVEAQIAGYEAVMREKRQRVEDDGQEVLDLFCDLYERDGIPRRDFITIKKFVEMIGLDATLEAVSIAFRKFRRSYASGFRYFCGVCWNRSRSPDGARYGSH